MKRQIERRGVNRSVEFTDGSDA